MSPATMPGWGQGQWLQQDLRPAPGDTGGNMGWKAPVVQALGAQSAETMGCPRGSWRPLCGDQEA